MCSSTMEFNWETQELPHFGEALLVSGTCCCGFRHTDTMLLEQNEPLRHSLVVEDVLDLNARVVRSSSGTIRIPELGIDVEPGYASESYISNVEGVLARISEIVAFVTRSAAQSGDGERTRRGEEILESIRLALQGQFRLTLMIEDPLGNSSISSDNVVITGLSKEEVAGLSTGMIVLETEHAGT